MIPSTPNSAPVTSARILLDRLGSEPSPEWYESERLDVVGKNPRCAFPVFSD